MHPITELLLKLILSAVIGVLVGLLDGPLFAMNIPWWMCATIGIVIVFGGVLIIDHADDW